MKVIRLPMENIKITLGDPDPKSTHGAYLGGHIKSDLSPRTDRRITEYIEPEFDGALCAIESLILAHAVAGVDVESPGYIEGITTTLDKLVNEYF